MKKFSSIYICLTVLYSILGTSTADKTIYCYYGTWAGSRTGDGAFTPANIDPNLCTHISYAFFGINQLGEFQVLEPNTALDDGSGYISKIIALKETNPKLKVMASVGGWAEGSANYSDMAADANKKQTFIQTTLKFIQEHKFDGLDLDWEYPYQREGSRPEDKDNFVTLLSEIYKKFNPLNLLVAIATGASETTAAKSYDIANIAPHVDFINVMTYDFATHGRGVVGYNSPLRGQGEKSVEAAINYWLQQGAPAHKVLLGLPFYGRTFKLVNEEEFSPGSPVNGPGEKGPYTDESGYLGYNEICLKDDTWSYTWADEQSVPFLHKGTQFISFDNANSISIKVDFANSLDLGGVMIWSIETDDFLGKCSDSSFPLLHTINSKIYNP